MYIVYPSSNPSYMQTQSLSCMCQVFWSLLYYTTCIYTYIQIYTYIYQEVSSVYMQVHAVQYICLVYWSLISHFLGLWRRPRLLLHFSREIKSRFRNPKFPLDLLVAALHCATFHYIPLHFTTFHCTGLFEWGCSLFPAWAGPS